MSSKSSETDGTERRLKVKHRVLGWTASHPNVASRMLDGFDVWLRMSPMLGSRDPLTNPKSNHFVNLPVNANIEIEDVDIPLVIAIELIKKSKHLVIMDKCACRSARDCQSHTHDVGCLFLGESGLDMNPKASRVVTQQEAIEHVHKAVAAGLIPRTGKFRADNFAFLVPDRKRLMAICFCCDCCCFVGSYRHVPSDSLDLIHPWLPGLGIDVTSECTGCGACVDTCYMDAISIQGGRAVHSAKCRGCGRCATACPRGGVVVSMTDPGYVDKEVKKLLSYVTLD